MTAERASGGCERTAAQRTARVPLSEAAIIEARSHCTRAMLQRVVSQAPTPALHCRIASRARSSAAAACRRCDSQWRLCCVLLSHCAVACPSLSQFAPHSSLLTRTDGRPVRRLGRCSRDSQLRSSSILRSSLIACSRIQHTRRRRRCFLHSIRLRLRSRRSGSI